MLQKPFAKAFTLLETMLALTALSGIASLGYIGFIEVNTASKAVKLEHNVAVINNALRVYEAHGGTLKDLTSPQEIIEKLKTVPTDENHKEIIGLRESMVDRRLEIVMQTQKASSTRNPRALWDNKLKRFVVARRGGLGIESFRMNEDYLNEVQLAEKREVTLKLAKKSNWVWDYSDEGSRGSNHLAPVNVALTSSVPFGPSNTYSGPLNLNLPSFSSAGGNYDLLDFENFKVSLTNPNPRGSSQIFYSLDGNSWYIYSGQSFDVNPGGKIAALAASLKPESWVDSAVSSSSYTVDPVQLAIGIDVLQNPVNYVQLGGDMVSSNWFNSAPSAPIQVSLSNAQKIPDRYQNSNTFKIAWSFDESDPLTKTENTSGRFSGGFPGTEFGYTLEEWGKKDHLRVKVAAKSLDSGILADSEVSEVSIGINKINLRQPISNVTKDGTIAGDQKISIAPVIGRGDLPEGWRIFYTSDGTDPAYNESGEPTRGTLYTEPFDLFSGSSNTVKISARVYGPTGYSHWFNPSLPYTVTVNRWQVPEWEGYVGGSFFKNSYATFHNIRQHSSGGGLDLSFDPRSGLNSAGKALALQADGKAIVGGQFTSVNGFSRNRIVRLNVNGSVDTTFDPGTGFDDEVLTVLIQPDGKIVVGGKFTKYNGNWQMGLARLHADGKLDRTFQVGRGVHSDQNGWVHALVMQDQGLVSAEKANGENYKIIVAGCFTRYNFVPAYSLARVNLNGSLDLSFDTSGGVRGIIHGVSVDDEGDLVIGGNFNKYDGVPRNNIARVDGRSGRNDESFSPGEGASDPVYTVNVYDNDKIFAGGAFDTFDGKETKSVARLNSDGSLDRTFDIGEAGGIQAWSIYSSAVTGDGKVFVGGNFESEVPESGPRGAFLRLNVNGEIDPSYSPEKLPHDASVWAIAARPSERVLITGDFPEAYVRTTENIARLNTQTGQIDSSFNVESGADEEVHVVEKLSDGSILVGGSFNRINGIAKSCLAKLSAGGSVLDFDVEISGGDVYAVAEQGDGKILIGGSFRSVNGNTSLRRIARLNVDGTLDLSFDPPGTTTRTWIQTHPWKDWVGVWNTATTSGFDGTVRSIVILEDGSIIVGGEFNQYGGGAQPSVALLNSDASINERLSLLNKNVPSSGSVYQTLAMNDGRILYVGNFSGKVKCLLRDGTIDSSFVPASINGAVRSAAVQADGQLIIGGDFTRVGGKELERVAVLNSDGSVSDSFDSENGANGTVNKVFALRDGGAVVVGTFKRYGSDNRRGIARLRKNGSIAQDFKNSALEINSINTTN